MVITVDREGQVTFLEFCAVVFMHVAVLLAGVIVLDAVIASGLSFISGVVKNVKAFAMMRLATKLVLIASFAAAATLLVVSGSPFTNTALEVIR